MTRANLQLLVVILGGIVGAWWADTCYRLVFPDSGARPGDASWTDR